VSGVSVQISAIHWFQLSVKLLEGWKAWMLKGSMASSFPAFWLPSLPASKLFTIRFQLCDQVA
jgi:hypothetical protein